MLTAFRDLVGRSSTPAIEPSGTFLKTAVSSISVLKVSIGCYHARARANKRDRLPGEPLVGLVAMPEICERPPVTASPALLAGHRSG